MADRSLDPTELFLRHLFRRATTLALVAAAMPLSACQEEGALDRGSHDGGESDGSSPDAAGTDAGWPDASLEGGADSGRPGKDPELAAACDTHGRELSAAGVSPAEPVDYLAVRRRYDYGGQVGSTASEWTEQDFEVLTETGSPCETATSADCEAQVARHPAAFTATGGIQVAEEISVVTTAGDTVAHYAGVERLRELFGEVDTLDEASLVALSMNYAVCGGRKGAEGELIVYGTRLQESCAPIIETIYELRVQTGGDIEVWRSAQLSYEEGACIGRRPAGLCGAPHSSARSALADYLASCAYLEAASVHAFEQLARDLERLGAPASLVARALEAAEDERRHADVVGDLARSEGGLCARVQVDDVGPRDLEAIATENAVEGCVRETFGVLVGAHQSLHAERRALADAMVPIVRDETRHAALSWDVHAWAMEALDAAARERVRSQQRQAVEQLGREVRRGGDPGLGRLAGTPDASVKTAMFELLRRELWS